MSWFGIFFVLFLLMFLKKCVAALYAEVFSSISRKTTVSSIQVLPCYDFFFWDLISNGRSNQILQNNGNSNSIPVAKQLKFIMEKIVILQYFQQELRSTNWSQDYLLRYIQPQDWTPLTKIEDSCWMRPKPSIYSLSTQHLTHILWMCINNLPVLFFSCQKSCISLVWSNIHQAF